MKRMILNASRELGRSSVSFALLAVYCVRVFYWTNGETALEMLAPSA